MEFTLRPWRITDKDNLIRYANNIHIAQFLTNQFPHPYTSANADNFIQWANSHSPTQIFAIDSHGEAIGSIGLHPQQDIFCKNAELGYWLAEPFWHKGIMTSAVPQMVEYGFNTFDIHRIFARPFGSNIGSQKVLERAGFILEATIQQSIFKNNVFEDELIYAVRREIA